MEIINVIKQGYSKNKFRIIHSLIILICFILMIFSLLNIRSGNKNDSKDVESSKGIVNTCCFIILGLSFIVLIRSVYIHSKISKNEFDDDTYSYKYPQTAVVYVFPFLLLILSIMIKINISSILPDSNDKDAIDKFNKDEDNHLGVDTIKKSSDGLLIMSIILFLWSIGHIAYTLYSPEKPVISKETIYDKKMDFLKNTILKAENELNEARDKGKASRDWLAGKATVIQNLKLEILKLNKEREEQIQSTITENLKTYEQYNKALQEAKSRTQDELMFEESRGLVDVDSVVPEHLQDSPLKYKEGINIRLTPRPEKSKTNPTTTVSEKSRSGSTGRSGSETTTGG